MIKMTLDGNRLIIEFKVEGNLDWDSQRWIKVGGIMQALGFNRGWSGMTGDPKVAGWIRLDCYR
jgi:hypothetical protein